MVRYSTSHLQALEQAKKLIGCYPHARPPDPDSYRNALADVFQQYPFGVVEECCNPLTGIARSREFPPTIACLVEWCDRHLGAYRNIAARKVPPPEVEHSEEHCATMRERIKAVFDELKQKLTVADRPISSKAPFTDEQLRQHYTAHPASVAAE